MKKQPRKILALLMAVLLLFGTGGSVLGATLPEFPGFEREFLPEGTIQKIVKEDVKKTYGEDALTTPLIMITTLVDRSYYSVKVAVQPPNASIADQKMLDYKIDAKDGTILSIEETPLRDSLPSDNSLQSRIIRFLFDFFVKFADFLRKIPLFQVPLF
ncbi:MAG: hypothetical protein LBN05_05945 [Oscillospiraceae bacterium]|jgi:hypothetical protein|nr:hypothetical protein [Oscillospiraceae bacterium]